MIDDKTVMAAFVLAAMFFVGLWAVSFMCVGMGYGPEVCGL